MDQKELFEVSKTLETECAPTTVAKRVADCVAIHSGRIVESNASPDELVAKFGSQWRMRLFGAWKVPLERLPKRALVRFTPRNGAQTEILVRVWGTPGFGWIDHKMAHRYELGVEELVDQLANAVASPPSDEI